MKAILIYSGGLDSTTLLHEYRDSIVLALSFDYGARHNKKELAFAEANCRKLGIRHMVIPLEFIGKYFRSDLLLGSGGDIPDGGYTDASMRSTVVPFRNGIMLAVATGLAESIDADTVLIANHSGDHAIYPDCRPGFIAAFDEAASAGTYNGVRIVSPYCGIDKRAIALRGLGLGVDFAMTWSCYRGGDRHCGKCGTCSERKEALLGFDPTEYEE